MSKVSAPDPCYFKTSAAADYMGISRRYLCELVSQGRIRHSRVGRRTLLFSKDDLDDFFERHVVASI
ncbi:helix-turn-helix domain-containing protein [Pontiella desulfatans]|uniref:helix-turn-helix domain-containing protein n=1 Tax=Pontiella desulfatans TaxID=2750659 RepID=UPI0014444A5D